MKQFADAMAQCYGFDSGDLKIGFFNGDEEDKKTYAGYYDDNCKCIFLNMSRLCVGLPGGLRLRNEAQTDVILDDCIDTIIHELRHAYQWKAIRKMLNNENYSEYDIHNRVSVWYENFCNYISPSDDLEGYYNQILERDARGVAAHIMEAYETNHVDGCL